MVNNAGVAPEVDTLTTRPGGLRLHEMQSGTFDRTMSTNLRGVFLGCKYALAQFMAQDQLLVNSRGDATRGWIVNTASLAGLVAFAGTPAYTTSKHAVVGLTKQIAVDYAKDRIHCNALCPSCKYLSHFWSLIRRKLESDHRLVIDTALIAALTRNEANPVAVETTQALVAAHPWGTIGQVEDVARAAVFLVSEDSQWVTGVPLVIDGGYSAQ